jgi:hypothetical protein
MKSNSSSAGNGTSTTLLLVSLCFILLGCFSGPSGGTSCHWGAQASRVGDEHYSGTNDGLFYIFAKDGIHIVDPFTQEVVKTIEGAESWGDATYIRDYPQIRRYVFANDASGKMWVLDADTQTVVSQVEIGPSPVHIYAVTPLDEVWTHSDAGGHFDV